MNNLSDIQMMEIIHKNGEVSYARAMEIVVELRAAAAPQVVADERALFSDWLVTIPLPVQENIKVSMARGESYTHKAFCAAVELAANHPGSTKIEGATFICDGAANPVSYSGPNGKMAIDLRGWTCYTPGAAPVQAQEPRKPTDLSARLRSYIDQNLMPYPSDVLAAADEIERYYGGMMAWKQTAEKKDADWNAERMARVDDRIANRNSAPVQPVAVPEGGNYSALVNKDSIIRFGASLVGHASTTDFMEEDEVISWVKPQYDGWFSSIAAPAAQGDAIPMVDDVLSVLNSAHTALDSLGIGKITRTFAMAEIVRIRAAIAAKTSQCDLLDLALKNMFSIEVTPFDVSIVAMATKAERDEDVRGDILSTEPWHKNGPSLKKATVKAIERAMAAKAVKP